MKHVLDLLSRTDVSPDAALIGAFGSRAVPNHIRLEFAAWCGERDAIRTPDPCYGDPDMLDRKVEFVHMVLLEQQGLGVTEAAFRFAIIDSRSAMFEAMIQAAVDAPDDVVIDREYLLMAARTARMNALRAQVAQLWRMCHEYECMRVEAGA